MRHEKAEILLQLARRLAASAEGLTLDEMAEAAGVGRRTAERMRDALWQLFPQMTESPDGSSKRFRIPGGLDGFLQGPTAEELVSLGAAVDEFELRGATDRAEALRTLDLKVRSAMRAADRRRMAPDIEALMRAQAAAVQAGPRSTEDQRVVATVRHALMAMKAVRFVYRGGSAPGTWRTVTPYGLIFARVNYLVAADQGSTEPKTRRLDRIEQIEVLEDVPAAPPPDFDLQAFADRSFGIYQDAVEDVVLRVRPEKAEDAYAWRFHSTQTLEPQDDGSVLVRFHASGMRELAWHLFSWEDQIEILAPASLRTRMIELLRGALARHEGTA
ncbi:YafY family protein [Caulobacter sp. 17J80-11]|uniref:helix-turn-helix transcriptional regulator n=1 Tax=Caulobacter sp. 17J80-11 TaxID=2763502 RepID=UPI001653C41D|nr:WYL domain-containing protein [Caulobacter sp. 17J80-11]MBC6983279.1 WYL domain-containing protein [Caulobacter sp. 17J80-11]